MGCGFWALEFTGVPSVVYTKPHSAGTGYRIDLGEWTERQDMVQRLAELEDRKWITKYDLISLVELWCELIDDTGRAVLTTAGA